MPLNINIDTLNGSGPGDQEILRPLTGESNNHLRIEDGQMKAIRGFASAARKTSPASQPGDNSQMLTSAEFQNFMHIKDRIDRSGQSSNTRSGPSLFSS